MKCLVKEERRRTRAEVMLQIHAAVGQTLNQAWLCFLITKVNGPHSQVRGSQCPEDEKDQSDNSAGEVNIKQPQGRGNGENSPFFVSNPPALYLGSLCLQWGRLEMWVTVLKAGDLRSTLQSADDLCNLADSKCHDCPDRQEPPTLPLGRRQDAAFMLVRWGHV